MAKQTSATTNSQLPECWRLAKTFEKELKLFFLALAPAFSRANNNLPRWANYLKRRQNYFSPLIAFLSENKGKKNAHWQKNLAEIEANFLQTKKHLAKAALSQSRYLETIAILLARLDLLYLSFGEEFNLPRGYNLLMPQFSQEQMEMIEVFKKNPAQGLKLAWQYIAQEPENKITYAVISDFYMGLGEYQRALLFLEAGARYNPSDYIIYYLWGVALAKTWRFNKSLKVLKRAAELKGNDIQIQKNLGWAMVMLGRFKGDKKMLARGRDILKNALRHDPANPGLMVDLSQSYLMEHKIYTAFQWAKRAYRLAPKDKFTQIVYNNLSEIYKSYKHDKKFQEFVRSQGLESLPAEIIKKGPEEMDEYLARKFEIEFILEKLNQGQISPKEAEAQLKSLGGEEMAGQIIKVKDTNFSTIKVIKEYIDYHKQVPNVEEKISPQKLQAVIKTLFAKQAKEKDLKKAILILAHQGNKKALAALEEKLNQADGWLKLWLELAIDECRNFLSLKQDKKPKIVFKKA